MLTSKSRPAFTKIMKSFNKFNMTDISIIKSYNTFNNSVKLFENPLAKLYRLNYMD